MTRHFNAALVLVLCSACSGSSIRKVGSQYVKSGDVGPAGGVLTVSEADAPGMNIAGTTITIPPGALSTTTAIGIGLTSQPVVATGAHGPVIDFEPSGTVFAVPATVSIPVTLNGLDPSRIGVMAVEPSGTLHDITAVTVANGLATFQVSGFTHYGCHDEGGADGGSTGTDGGGTCTPSCAGDATCGSSDGCGGVCDGTCGDGGGTCTPSCAGDATCGSSDGCGGVCDGNCSDGGGTCTPSCSWDAECGSSDGCGGTCDENCSDGGCTVICLQDGGECSEFCDGGCTASCATNTACGSSDGCGGTCDGNCLADGGTLVCNGDAGESFCGSFDGQPYCANLSDDPSNCGICGGSCGEPNSDCVNGQCVCADSETLCGDPDAGVPSFCIDTSQNPENCGACGNVCADSYAIGSGCRFGACTCSPGQTYLCGTAGTAGAQCLLNGESCDGG